MKTLLLLFPILVMGTCTANEPLSIASAEVTDYNGHTVMLKGDVNLELGLGAIHSEHADRGKLRNYDYGSGLGFKFRGSVYSSGRALLTLAYSGFWVHVLDGAEAEHLAHTLAARLQFPVFRYVALGLDYELYLRDSFFEQFPTVHRRNSQVRTYLTGLFR